MYIYIQYCAKNLKYLKYLFFSKKNSHSQGITKVPPALNEMYNLITFYWLVAFFSLPLNMVIILIFKCFISELYHNTDFTCPVFDGTALDMDINKD